MTALLPAPDGARMDSLALPSTVAVESRLGDVAILDRSGRLLGVVPAATVIGILRHEHVEDMCRMAGVMAHDRRSRRALEERPVDRLVHGLPRPIVGLAGSGPSQRSSRTC
jgi:magnesium transporter